MPNELKPCPFCGAKVKLNNSNGLWYIMCHECRAKIDCVSSIKNKRVNYRDKGEVIAAWNRRVG